MPDPTDRQRAEAKAQQFIRMAKADIALWKHYHGDKIHLSAQAASYLQSMLASGTTEAYELGRSEGWEAGREEAAQEADRLSVGKTTDGLYTYDEPVGVTIRSLEYKEP